MGSSEKTIYIFIFLDLQTVVTEIIFTRMKKKYKNFFIKTIVIKLFGSVSLKIIYIFIFLDLQTVVTKLFENNCYKTFLILHI